MRLMIRLDIAHDLIAWDITDLEQRKEKQSTIEERQKSERFHEGEKNAHMPNDPSMQRR